MPGLIPFFIVIAVVIAVSRAAMSAAGKKPARPAGVSNAGATPPPQVNRAADAFREFQAAVSSARIPLETMKPRTGSMSGDSGEGKACDIPHSNEDPRVTVTAAGSLAGTRTTGDVPPAAQADTTATLSRTVSRLTAGEMRRAVITSEILAKPKSIRRGGRLY